MTGRKSLSNELKCQQRVTWKWTCELAVERDRESERREMATMTDAPDE
ncbi:MAG: hypothetical protein ABSA06_01210 [Geobacteraceae bacterium]